jgi:hypothetical protein
MSRRERCERRGKRGERREREEAFKVLLKKSEEMWSNK